MIFDVLFIPLALYTASAVVVYLIPSSWKKSIGIISIYSSFLATATSAMYFFGIPLHFSSPWFGAINFELIVNSANIVFISVFNAIFSLFMVYCFRNIKKSEALNYMLAAASVNMVLMAENILVLVVFWGVLLLLLYTLLQEQRGSSSQIALITLGISDFLMLLGIIFLATLSGSYSISSIVQPQQDSALYIMSIFLLLIAGISKAGAPPFHNWIISAASSASSVKTLILFPAIVDKILGIYFILRILPAIQAYPDIFRPLLLVLGAATLIYAVVLALGQHDLKRLLSYHAVSQVGYILLGLGTLNTVGVFGGALHMFNNVIYKSALFMGAGVVQESAGTLEIDKLGSLSRKMPRTFASMFISSLAISGVPPTNGFISKWLIFQGLLMAMSQETVLTAFSLFIALTGSSLTLASFLKVLHGVFLRPSGLKMAVSIDSVASVWLPQSVLAATSLVMGVVFAAYLTTYQGVAILSETSFAALLIITASIIFGVVILQSALSKKIRKTEVFFGGEEFKKEFSSSASDFYRTLEIFGPIRKLYAEITTENYGFYSAVINLLNFISGFIYFAFERVTYLLNLGVLYVVNGLSSVLKLLHSGELYIYVSWYLIGFAALLWLLVK